MKNNKAPSPTGVRTELREMIETIGGEGVLLSLLEKFYLRMSEDIIVGFFFDGKDLKKIARLQANFMLAASGLNPNYAGRSPSTAHIALAPILSGAHITALHSHQGREFFLGQPQARSQCTELMPTLLFFIATARCLIKRCTPKPGRKPIKTIRLIVKKDRRAQKSDFLFKRSQNEQ